MAEKANVLAQVNDVYNHPGWAHIEKMIQDEITNCLMAITDLSTPIEEVDKLRILLAYNQRFLDKVEADKQQYKLTQSQQG
jgi:hypothetical protein